MAGRRKARATVVAVLLMAALDAGAVLENGGTLAAGACLQSGNGRYRLEMEGDGGLVVWEVLEAGLRREHWRAWQYQVALGTPCLTLRQDNKLVVYDRVPWLAEPVLIWEAGNVRIAPPGTGSLVLGDDGTLAILAGDRRIWEARSD